MGDSEAGNRLGLSVPREALVEVDLQPAVALDPHQKHIREQSRNLLIQSYLAGLGEKIKTSVPCPLVYRIRSMRLVSK